MRSSKKISNYRVQLGGNLREIPVQIKCLYADLIAVPLVAVVRLDRLIFILTGLMIYKCEIANSKGVCLCLFNKNKQEIS